MGTASKFTAAPASRLVTLTPGRGVGWTVFGSFGLIGGEVVAVKHTGIGGVLPSLEEPSGAALRTRTPLVSAGFALAFMAAPRAPRRNPLNQKPCRTLV